jgi:TusA-related sulfurtransferase
MHVIDARGLSCPEPVLLTKKKIESGQEETFQIMVDDPAALENISVLAKNLGWVADYARQGDQIEITLRK